LNCSRVIVIGSAYVENGYFRIRLNAAEYVSIFIIKPDNSKLIPTRRARVNTARIPIQALFVELIFLFRPVKWTLSYLNGQIPFGIRNWNRVGTGGFLFIFRLACSARKIRVRSVNVGYSFSRKVYHLSLRLLAKIFVVKISNAARTRTHLTTLPKKTLRRYRKFVDVTLLIIYYWRAKTKNKITFVDRPRRNIFTCRVLGTFDLLIVVYERNERDFVYTTALSFTSRLWMKE